MFLHAKLDAHEAEAITVHCFCNHCTNILGPFKMDDLLQPERIQCTECDKSEPVFHTLLINTDRIL